MKTVSGYLVKRGRTFYAEWTVNGKRFRQTTHKTTKTEAKTELARIMAPYLSGDEKRILEAVKGRLESVDATIHALSEERNPPLTIGEAWTTFLNSSTRPDTGKATLAVYALTWGRFWKWMKDNHPEVTAMRDVTPDIAGQFAAWLTSEGRSANTFNKYMNVMALVFRTLKDKARLGNNVWEDIARKRLVTYGRRELTIDELRNVCAAADGDLRLLLAIGLYTGLRLGDCATLRWGEVDLIRGRITRIPNKTGRRNPKPVMVPLHPTLAAMLGQTPQAQRNGFVMPRMATDYSRHSSYVTDRVQTLFEKCGIETRRAIEGRMMSQVEVGFHSLRHSFVSMCAENNVPLAVVQALVGHTSPAMTRHYQHTGEAAALAAVSALPSLTEENKKALPQSQSPRMVDAGAIRTGLEAMTAKNWKAQRAELLAMV